jgi:GNAT superfamily N-acetyltransferase
MLKALPIYPLTAERWPDLVELDDKRPWSIVCFFIKRQYRRQQLATSLLRAAVNYAFGHGAEVIESYPIGTWTETVTAHSAFPGIAAWFHEAGFREVMQTEARSGGQPRVIMRLER